MTETSDDRIEENKKKLAAKLRAMFKKGGFEVDEGWPDELANQAHEMIAKYVQEAADRAALKIKPPA